MTRRVHRLSRALPSLRAESRRLQACGEGPWAGASTVAAAGGRTVRGNSASRPMPPGVTVSLYPPFVRGKDARRRWRLVTQAVVVAFAYSPQEGLDRFDRAVIWTAQRSLYWSELPTGDCDLTSVERL